MRSAILAFGCLILLPGEGASTAESGLVKAMVRFDQAYIPVLALTSAEQLAPSRKGYTELEGEWRQFRQAHGNAFPADARWAEDLDAVEASLLKAGRVIQAGQHLKEAHEALEHVRQIFMRARERLGIDYFVDHLTRFHDPMEKIVLKCKNTLPQDLSGPEVQELDRDLRMAQQLWAKVRAAKFDADLFEFDEGREATMRQDILMETKAIGRLEKALTTGEADAIIAAGQDLKPPFAGCFKLFGRFPAGGK